MIEFDDYIRNSVKDDKTEVPSSVIEKIEQTLADLPEQTPKKGKAKVFPQVLSIAACFLLVFLVLLPNISTVYAQTLERIPFIGSVVKVVTVRNYTYSDNYHEMNISVPKLESEISSTEIGESELPELDRVGDNSQYDDAIVSINNDIEELTRILKERFESDLNTIGDQGHGSVYLDYDVVTNTEAWFTLKIRVYEAAGSSNTYYKYYHIDKTSGSIVTLGDLAENDTFYSVVEAEIKRQMREQMEEDTHTYYWVDDPKLGQDFVALDKNHNFYWDENGDLVIVFDKYEVAPGSMGTPEFAVSKAIFADYLKREFRE